ncbi:ceroid-lipofuscinosis neuronal protein 6 homolog isoform X1 [Astatotilapia calliptera]|uniref:ceroid-lipofuscinosis neuronal protein 6 homolog isoform X1 n=1 Tax=Astatotilapia calliptera TaxID=8154 RepID=UPI000329B18B|nr:ceroid-lipofuscinosis neuronal protein 6 homolog isoform X1 [Astatotilapia calliptera]XP_026028188.1 ceroid-lipofuscinosis neuronal protein 6 homolog isoform X1 [Astatotilapia calliptera]
MTLRTDTKTSTRKRENPALRAAAFMCSRSAGSTQVEAVLPRPRFHLDLWLSFTFQNWILDVGRPVVMLVLPADWLPLQHPGVADHLHFLYNVTAPLILLKMLERSPWMLPGLAVRLGIIAVSMGTTLHLVADSITRRLLLIGYQLHLPVRENPIMRNLKPSALVDVFELLFHYDDTVGHMMWYVPFFLVLVLFFNGCFSRREQEERMPPSAWMLLAPNAAYYWYLITEGQTFILFTFTFFAMTTTVMHQRRRGLFLNSDGLFMFYSSDPGGDLGGLSVERQHPEDDSPRTDLHPTALHRLHAPPPPDEPHMTELEGEE